MKSVNQSHLISEDKKKKIFMWLCKNHSNNTLFILFEKKINFFHKYKNNFEKIYEADCFAFIKTLEEVYDQENILNSKHKSMSLNSIKEAADIRKFRSELKGKRSQEKFEFLLEHKDIILKMRNVERLTLREIAKALVTRKYILNTSFRISTSLTISHTFIATFLKIIGNTHE